MTQAGNSVCHQTWPSKFTLQSLCGRRVLTRTSAPLPFLLKLWHTCTHNIIVKESKIEVYFLKLCQVWCVAVSSQIGTFCAVNKQLNSFRKYLKLTRFSRRSLPEASNKDCWESLSDQPSYSENSWDQPTYLKEDDQTTWGHCNLWHCLWAVQCAPGSPSWAVTCAGVDLGDVAVCVISAPVSNPY